LVFREEKESDILRAMKDWATRLPARVTGTAWTSHRGLDRERIPQFVQELAFRYNNRQTDLFPLVLHKIAESCTGP